MRRLFWLMVPLANCGCVVDDPYPPPGSRELYGFDCGSGVTCEQPADSCYELTFSPSTWWTMCSLQCDSDDDCPAGACLHFSSGGLCFRSCRHDDDCAWGYCADMVSPALEGAPTRRVCWFYPAPDVNCTAAKTCADCTPLPGCGWCETSGQCSSSNEHCEGFPQTWVWEPGECAR